MAAQFPLHFDSALRMLDPGVLAHPAVQDYMRGRASVLTTALRGVRAEKQRKAQQAIDQEQQLRQQEAEQREHDRIPNELAEIRASLRAIEQRLAEADKPKPTRYDWGNSSVADVGPPATEAWHDRLVTGRAAVGEGGRQDVAAAGVAASPVVESRPPLPKHWIVKVGKRGADGKVTELRITPGVE